MSYFQLVADFATGVRIPLGLFLNIHPNETTINHPDTHYFTIIFYFQRALEPLTVPAANRIGFVFSRKEAQKYSIILVFTCQIIAYVYFAHFEIGFVFHKKSKRAQEQKGTRLMHL